jgi:general L-amino acid transport system permease protein
MRRAWIYQGLMIAAILAVLGLIISATNANLARLGVESSIDFLWRRAGFEISQTLIPYDANSTIARAFVVALLNTLVLAAGAIIGASLLGLLVGTARMSRNWLVSRLATAYVELFRNIPSLLQIFFWYFVVLRALPRSRDSLALMDVVFLNNRGLFLPWPELQSGVLLGSTVLIGMVIMGGIVARRLFNKEMPTGPVLGVLLIALASAAAFGVGVDWEIARLSRFGYAGGLVIMPEFIALVVGLSMYNATYISEIVRSSFAAIPKGQQEAAASLGLSPFLILRLVLFPQALRTMIPPLTTVYLNLFKSTSLAAAIAYPEVVSVFVGTVNNLVGQPVIIMAVTLMIYILISLLIAAFLNWYNKRLLLVTG